MYSRLAVIRTYSNVYVRLESNDHVGLIDGRLVSSDVTIPFEFSARVDPGDDGLPQEPVWLPAYRNFTLLRHDLVETIESAGADNIETFPAVITRQDTGELSESYRVFNVVGLVSCANMDESKATPLADVNVFHSLVIDPTRTKGLKLFRLAEAPQELIVDEEIASAIRSREFDGLIVEDLTEVSVS